MTRVAIVTGGGSGIGRAAALELSRRGWRVCVAGRRPDRLEETVGMCAGRAVALACDVTVAADRDALAAGAFDAIGPGDLPALVNAAGFARFGAVGEVSDVEFERQVAVNLTGPAALCGAVLPAMRRAGRGRIVNVLSVAARHVFAGAAGYGASKAGLLQFGRSLALEARSEGIYVTALLPGAVDTPLWDGSEFVPDRADMLSAEAVAQTIADVLEMPDDRVVEELTLTPPKGIL